MQEAISKYKKIAKGCIKCNNLITNIQGGCMESMSNTEGATKSKKSFFKKPAFWIIAVIAVLIASSGASSDDSKQSSGTPEAKTAETTKTEEPAVKEDAIAPEFKSALAQADSYANKMNMSKKGVYEQLVSEYGGQFEPEAAQYAIDNVKSDWNANALASAKTYQEKMNMSPAAIRDQLISPYGGKFTEPEADFAIQNLNK
jgi:hypothetical protein